MAKEFELMMYMWEKHLKNNSGTYIDIGANNGVYHSTTSILNDNNWVGYNIEANKYSYEELIINRPNDNNFNIAISDTNGEMEFYYYKSEGIHPDFNSEKVGYKVGSATLEKNVVNSNKQNWISTNIKSNTYCDFIKENNITEVDFLNIDIEGHEMTVLNDMVKSDILPRVILVEVVIIDKKKLNQLLSSFGYIKDECDISEGDWIYFKSEEDGKNHMD